jgi:hypothetical protein
MADSSTQISFGFLPYKWEINFDYGTIVPTNEYDRALKYVKKLTNKDGYIYPPIEKEVQADLNWKPVRTIPKTKRPAHLYRLPPSHDLYISPAKSEPNIREGSAGFIIHLLAFLFKTRLQFANWFFDGRIKIDCFGAYVRDPHQTASYLSHAYGIWSKWSDNEQKRFTNILYMYSRTSIYQWDWEEFIIQYMVLDACWRMAERLFGLRAKNHGDRVNKLCEKFSLTGVPKILDIPTMIKLRNDLFHETLWHEGRPGSTIGKLGYHMPTRMGYYLNSQLIAAFLELQI